jgi:hypothetical protein
MWLGANTADDEISRNIIQFYHMIFRVLSKYYLEHIAINYLLVSKKSKKSQLNNHMNMRKWLLNKLRVPVLFKCYKDFELK